MIGYLLEISLNLVWRRLKVCLCDVKWSLVSTAMAIWSFTKWSELKITNYNFSFVEIWLKSYLWICWVSFKYMSLLLFTPWVLKALSLDPFNKSSLSRRDSCWELVLRKSRDKSSKISRWRCIVCNIAAPDTGCSANLSLTVANCTKKENNLFV